MKKLLKCWYSHKVSCGHLTNRVKVLSTFSHDLYYRITIINNRLHNLPFKYNNRLQNLPAKYCTFKHRFLLILVRHMLLSMWNAVYIYKVEPPQSCAIYLVLTITSQSKNITFVQGFCMYAMVNLKDQETPGR